MEPSPPAVGTYKPLRQGHQLHIECGLVMRTRARPFKYSGSRPLSCRRRRRRAGRSAGRGRRMSRTAARCSSERSSSIPPGSTIRIEVGKCHRGRRGGMRKGSGNNVEFPLSFVDGFMGPPSIFYLFSSENSRRNPCKCNRHAHGGEAALYCEPTTTAAWSATARSGGSSSSSSSSSSSN